MLIIVTIYVYKINNEYLENKDDHMNQTNKHKVSRYLRCMGKYFC